MERRSKKTWEKSEKYLWKENLPEQSPLFSCDRFMLEKFSRKENRRTKKKKSKFSRKFYEIQRWIKKELKK